MPFRSHFVQLYGGLDGVGFGHLGVFSAATSAPFSEGLSEFFVGEIVHDGVDEEVDRGDNHVERGQDDVTDADLGPLFIQVLFVEERGLFHDEEHTGGKDTSDAAQRRDQGRFLPHVVSLLNVQQLRVFPHTHLGRLP